MEEEPIEFSLTANLYEKPSDIADKVRDLLLLIYPKSPRLRISTMRSVSLGKGWSI